jgi:2-polyprenyl-3-methyl-5-hydroxy-6-metoxy-1,4-benzoquinol methylase
MTMRSQQIQGTRELSRPTQSKKAIQERLDELKLKYGDWAYDIPLPHGIWTRGNLQKPHTRLKRIVQIANDLSTKPLSECRVLDLGCLDGIFSIEFALHGATTVGVEIREANIQKALFCKEVLELDNLDFRQDDVRNVSLESYGKFDVIVCSGILYHLPAFDAINLIKRMFEMGNRVVIIDTHVSLSPEEEILFEDNKYWGDHYREHPADAALEEKAKRLWSSIDNETSFWFTRSSLINIISKTGFFSVYECFTPTNFIPTINFRNSGITAHDRCTFVAIKDNDCTINTSPATNKLWQAWPEHSLSYTYQKTTSKSEQAARIEELSRQHAEIINSKAWKLAMLLRKLRIALIPPGSTREKVARFLLRPVLRPTPKEGQRK